MESSHWGTWGIPWSLPHPTHHQPCPWSESSGRIRAEWQGSHLAKMLPTHAWGHACPALVTGQDQWCCPTHQDLSQFFFLAFPRLLSIHLSSFLPGPKRAEKNISLLHLRSKYVSAFPFPFFFFLQSSHNRAANSERLPFSVYWQVNSRSWDLESWSPACKFRLYQLDPSFLIWKMGILKVLNWQIKIRLSKVILKNVYEIKIMHVNRWQQCLVHSEC